MSFPSSSSSSFGAQVAAIMDVLAKAAVAEITKLMEEGTVLLRLEMRRRDAEIQELKRSLQRTEAELYRAQEAVAASAATARPPQDGEVAEMGEEERDKEEKAEAKSSGTRTDRQTDEPIQSVCHESNVLHVWRRDSQDLWQVMKMEPADDRGVQDPPAPPATRCDEGAFATMPEGQMKSLWLPSEPGSFDNSSVEATLAKPPRSHIFSSHAEQYPSQRNLQNFFESSEEVPNDAFTAPIKVEVEVRPVCMESPSSKSHHGEASACLSRAAVGENQPTLQEPGPSLVPHVVQRPAEATPESHPTHHFLRNDPSRPSARPRRHMGMWRGSQKVFLCSVCGRGFSRLSQLEEHKVLHGSFKPFRCLECGKSFTQKTRLKTHQSVHTGERPFSCKICGKMFSRQDNCLRHERFHSGLKPFSCGQCGKSFTVLGNLKIHQEIHLRGR